MALPCLLLSQQSVHQIFPRSTLQPTHPQVGVQLTWLTHVFGLGLFIGLVRMIRGLKEVLANSPQIDHTTVATQVHRHLNQSAGRACPMGHLLALAGCQDEKCNDLRSKPFENYPGD